MAGVTVTIAARTQPVTDALRQLERHLGDLSRPFRDVGEYLLRATDERFRAERAPDGTPWAQNSDVTLTRYLASRRGLSRRRTATGGRTLTQRGARALGAKKILRDSGALQDTLRYQADAASLRIGTNRVYGAMQQFGGLKSQYPHLWGDIPARPFLGLSSADETQLVAILTRHLARLLP